MLDLSLFESDELLALAKLDVEKNRIDSALAKLKQANNLPDPQPECDSLLAKLYAQLNLFDRASYHYESYLMKQPDALLERFQYGMVYYEQGIKDRALLVWKEVLDEVPTFPPALYYCALVSWEDSDESEARRLIDILLKSAPADNLYFKRSKDLLNALDSNANSGSVAAPRFDSQKIN
ncbi:hypothetical protein BTA51_00135 [Hahella sp. CCB-MM4]|uniref:tetratricopeptide repeat protein n=1 Tax=Hahella sp. (strain CCB-MM4) TaxID=1926491 RepID=UPI000B9ADF6B|nr:hypothetical protein [Hahella sp. CCB-MM4]OZG74859.1 hypothetical protein BTA51_00135 [Hahella sp. CCB-MM4]